jgi:hypothetical protein
MYKRGVVQAAGGVLLEASVDHWGARRAVASVSVPPAVSVSVLVWPWHSCCKGWLT